MSRYPKLKIRIPLEYGDVLDLDRSHISRVNSGERRLTMLQCCQLLALAEEDPRLAGLNILQLRPEIKPALPYICKLCPRDEKKQAKQRKRRAK
jgi:hypothetical protein